jgi:Tetrahydrofolate dehydrogenase/cyclohydrolase, catalytic domain
MRGAWPRTRKAGTMGARIIDGNAVAQKIRGECRERAERIVTQSGLPSWLAVIVVGSDPASRLYVRNKIRARADVASQSFRYDYPADVKQDVVIEKIAASTRIRAFTVFAFSSRRHYSTWREFCAPYRPTRMSTAFISMMSAAHRQQHGFLALHALRRTETPRRREHLAGRQERRRRAPTKSSASR